MPTLQDIEQSCRKFADTRAALAQEVSKLNEQIETLKRAHLPQIKRLVARAAERHGELRSGIEAAPSLFEKPRTYIFHGIKVGFQKGKGSFVIEDEAFTLKRIHSLFDDTFPGVYIRTTEKPNKEALATLPACDLRKLGCSIADTTDEVVIKPTDSAVDKIVNALLKDATEDAA